MRPSADRTLGENERDSTTATFKNSSHNPTYKHLYLNVCTICLARRTLPLQIATDTTRALVGRDKARRLGIDLYGLPLWEKRNVRVAAMF